MSARPGGGAMSGLSRQDAATVAAYLRQMVAEVSDEATAAKQARKAATPGTVAYTQAAENEWALVVFATRLTDRARRLETDTDASAAGGAS